MKSKFITAQKAGTYDPNAANKSASVTIDSNKLELLKKEFKNSPGD